MIVKILSASLAVLALCVRSTYAEGAISSAAGLNQFFGGTRPGTVDFSITGVVTHVVANDSAGNFIVRDETGSANLYLGRPVDRKPGELVVAHGKARLTMQLEPCLWNVSCDVAGIGPTPAYTPTALAEIDSPAHYLQNVETEGIVADAFTDDLDRNYDFLILKDGVHTLPVACPHDPAHEKLIDAHVRVQGLFQPHIYGERKYSGPSILADNASDIVTVKPPPSDPFDFPPLTPARYISPQDIMRMGKRSASGTVLATYANRLVMKASNGRIVCAQLANAEKLPPSGSRITAVGYPETDLLRYHLTRARVRVDYPPSEGSLPSSDDETVRIFRETIGNGNFDNKVFGRTVTIEGIVRLLPSHELERLRLILDAGYVSIPVDFSSNPSADGGIVVGSRIEVTGCVVLETTLWHPNNIFPRVYGFSVVIRRPSDIRIVANPPWWTPGRLSVVIAILLGALVAFLIRNVVIARIGRMKLDERTQLAVELHDSLSQTLTGLACQVAAAQDSLTADPLSAESKLETASRILKSCRTDLRNCLFDLRNDTLAEKDLDIAVKRTLQPFEGETEISTRFNVKRSRINDATSHAVLAIVRELVANAVRHGHAWTVHVAGILVGDALMFSVKDDGSGFDPENRVGTESGHFGLSSIVERLKRLGGEISISSKPCGGTKVRVKIPIRTQ